MGERYKGPDYGEPCVARGELRRDHRDVSGYD